ncbi:phenylalanine--tRNA ligase beta subunit [Nanobdella aerobiophila]|uniref:phenylalanine--tRNA ligase n=1 Tax=Nanobdella aerobiophila TaxID=2586965 RepID=A0A915SY28_9ARCH|nr:phenylalanine--tRNA ligase subunit beta [Nanobdella aerobiophila]BBL45500.1 phenylalanine--tRNA ligase beta subunit [Nanobdella aerobiophila]
MATIDISLKELYKSLNLFLSKEDLEQYLLNIKCELDDINNDYAKIEIKDFNRPDLYTYTGIARELKGILDIEKGIPNIKINDSDYQIIVDRDLKDIRPYIVAAIVKNVNLNDDRLKDLIQLQEKISQSYGRNRQKIAIGTHNFDLINFPIYYKLADENIKFIPLGYDKELSLKEIINNTEVGKKYGYIINNKYPILIDNNNNIISMPPIINSNKIGKLDNNTRNIFIDISGTDLEKMIIALNIILLTLYEWGGEIYSVKIKYDNKEIISPQIKIIEKEFDYNKIKKHLGLDLKDEEIINYLLKKRIESSINNDRLKIRYLNYRDDLLSEYDIIEEILISYGYNNLKPKKLSIYTKGELNKNRKFQNLIRKLMVSMNCIEIYTPILSSYDINNILKEDKDILEIINPVSNNYNSIRLSLLTSFLQLLQESKEIKFPAKIFEVGKIAYLKDRLYQEDSLLYIYSNYKVSINDSKSVLERLFNELNIKFDMNISNYKFLIEGRQGNILVNNEIIGWIGDINPEVLDNIDIKYPLSGFEINLSKLIKYINYDI